MSQNIKYSPNFIMSYFLIGSFNKDVFQFLVSLRLSKYPDGSQEEYNGDNCKNEPIIIKGIKFPSLPLPKIIGIGPIRTTPPTVELEGEILDTEPAKTRAKPIRITIIPIRVNLIISDSLISFILVTRVV